MGSLYSSEIRSLMFPDSASVWMSEAIGSQRFSSLLLPPVVPYPAEWKLARAYLKAGKYRECADHVRTGAQTLPEPCRSAGHAETSPRRRKIIHPAILPFLMERTGDSVPGRRERDWDE